MSKIKTNTIENVAGTESHNVDTMGIESGGTDTERYIKFPDGTLIQMATFENTNYINQVSGNIFITPYTTKDFPIEFFDGIVFVQANTSTNDTWATIQDVNRTSFAYTSLSSEVGVQGTIISYTAIGRWK